MSTEKFWSGRFGDEYLKRSPGDADSNFAMFLRILGKLDGLQSVIEFGAGVGNNLKAIRQILPSASLTAVEVNQTAAGLIPDYVGVVNCPALDFRIDKSYDLVLTKGFLIHVDPHDLDAMYEKLYNTSARYILMCEYYNPKPVEIPYRGFMDVLWKRDFAGDVLDKYSDLHLVDYGFVYHRDANPQDDLTWFLLEKR